MAASLTETIRGLKRWRAYASLPRFEPCDIDIIDCTHSKNQLTSDTVVEKIYIFPSLSLISLCFPWNKHPQLQQHWITTAIRHFYIATNLFCCFLFDVKDSIFFSNTWLFLFLLYVCFIELNKWQEETKE